MAGKIAGGFIRLTNFVIRILQLCASVIVLGIMSYFLAVLADHDMEIGKWLQAVEGIAGAATLYTLVGSIFTLCIGGIAFFAAIAMMFDVLFAAAFVAVAVLTRDGTGSCEGRVTTPLGSGDVNDNAPGYGKGGFGTGDGQNLTFMPSLRSACTLQKGIFAISIIAIFLFLLSLYPQIAYVRHRRDVKRFGHSSTSGRRSFWRFGRGRPDSTTDYAGTGTPVGTIPLTETNPSPDLPAEKPPRYSRFFTRGKKVDPVKFEDPELAARPDGNGYGYGNSAYVYGNGKTAEPYYGVDNTSNATPAPPPQPAYGYGPSATANYGYSHGY